ncbi:helix-turn-helix domain-containing protein [Flavobacterium psychrotrophum]|uniref:helix-turn-helix domain-containing protein n=1 Tax=Flavobacterium psychrotrophum TaxID=2294119 RepID=UPI000E312567|nr:helix-turn-helix domain-containing protein [Flavobacterium psychrotrophum]
MNNPFETIDKRLNSIEALLASLQQIPPIKMEEVDLLTREQACDLLKINSSTLWHWTNRGKVKAYGIANRRYYKKSELLECLKPLKK